MPILRPFRALRFDVAGTDLSAVLCPPYDIIDPAERRELLERDAHNAVRIELPADLGTADEDAYRGAARTVAEWRSGGVLRKDREPSVTLHRMSWTTASGEDAQATGVYARLRLEPYAPGSGVLPHERTLGGPKEDRYALLRATGLNTSPIVVLGDTGAETHDTGAPDEIAGSAIDRSRAAIAALTSRAADATARTDGVRHEVWVVPTEDRGRDADGDRTDGAPLRTHEALPRTEPGLADGPSLLASLAAAPVTIADGHHRYETALRYREERGRNRACESDPAWDYVLALVYPAGGSPPALPTHRVLADGPIGEGLLQALDGLATVERLDGPGELLRRMAEAPPDARGASGTGRIGVVSGATAAILGVGSNTIDRRLPSDLSEASRGLDVNALGALIETVWDRDAGSLAGDGRLRYTKDAAEAVAIVTSGEAATAFLLDPIPAAAIARVAKAGEVMPQKSTYFHPKAPAGLLFSPMEW